MRRDIRLLLALVFTTLIPAFRVSAQAGRPTAITPEEIDAHLRFLASDLLEGRAPATRGGRLAEEYLATELQTFGVRPGVGDSSYFRRVPFDVVKADLRTFKVTASGRPTATHASTA